MIRTALAALTVAAAVTVGGMASPAGAAEGCHEGTCTPPPCTAEGCVKPPKPCVVVEGVSCVEGKSKARHLHVRVVRR